MYTEPGKHDVEVWGSSFSGILWVTMSCKNNNKYGYDELLYCDWRLFWYLFKHQYNSWAGK